MRISDWSSDVCSSDLVQRHYVNFADLESVAILGQHIELRSVAFECGAFVEHLAEHGLDGDDLAPDHQLAAELLLQPRCRRKMIGMGVGFDQDRKSTRLNSSH